MNKRFSFISGTALLFWIGTLLILQVQATSAQSPQYIVNWFTDSEGLPQNSIKDITPDKYGYIWLSTENGLVRYDGQGFKVYNQYLDGFSANRLFFFEGNIQKDSITISNVLGETLLINGHRIHRIKDSVPYHLRNPSLKFQLPKYPGNKIEDVNQHLQLKANGNTRFLIGHDSIKEFDDNSALKREYPFPTSVGDQFFILADSLFVLKNNKELFKVDNGTLENTPLHLNPDKRKDIYTNDNVGQSFLLSDKNIYLLKKVAGTVIKELIVEDFDFSSFEVYSIYYDSHNKILFIGSNTKGFCIVREKVFKTVLMDPHDPDQVEYALAAINDSTLVNPSGDLVAKGRFQGKLKFPNNTDKYLLAFDKGDHIWVKEHNRLYRYKKEGHYKKFDTWIFDKKITSLNLINNFLWVGTYGAVEGKGGLYRLDLDIPKPFPERITVPDTNISYIVEEREDRYVLGSNTGIHTLDLRLEFPQLKKVESLGSPEVRSLYRTGNDVWITTYGQGIFLYRNGNVFSFPLDKNGYLATAHCILEDKEGYFWISTNKGLFQVAKKSLYEYADHKIGNVYYQYYDKSAGFYTNEFNGGCYPCAVKQSDNLFSYPSLRGVVNFDPSSVPSNLPRYDIFLDQIEMDGNIIPFHEDFFINRKTERVTFNFSSPYYGNAYNNLIEVKLEGTVDNEWTFLNMDNSISYTSLKPGKYTLKARKVAGFGSSYTYKSFVFEIKPAFWQTKWFLVCLTLLTTYLIYLGVQMRTRLIRNTNVLLELKVSERTVQLKSTIETLGRTKSDLNKQILDQRNLMASLSHDIKTPLKYLAITGKYIYDNPKDDPENFEINVRSLYTSSLQLYQYIDNLLEYTKANTHRKDSNIETFNSHDLVQEKLGIFENIVRLRKISIGNLVAVNFEMTLNKQLFSLILHNLLDNAIKNTYNGHIVIRGKRRENSNIITIEDTGFGMSSEILKYYRSLSINTNGEKTDSAHKGLGLKIINDLIAIMDAEIEIESNLGKGTKVHLIFKDHVPSP
ncbi:MAG: ATP-binding protein [Sediminicola sp.]